MRLVKLIEFLFARLKTVKWACVGLLLMLVVVDALLVSKEHAHTGPEHIPGFWSVFGLIGCVLIIILSKWYGHAGIMTREDYYGHSPSGQGKEESHE